MKLFRPLCLYLLLVGSIPAILSAQEKAEKADIYAALDSLWQDLQAWSNESGKSPMIGDSINLKLDEAFAGYNYKISEISAQSNLLEAQLPPYLNLLTSKVAFLFTTDSQAHLAVEYISPFLESDSAVVYDDSIKVRVQADGDNQINSFSDLLRQRFWLYRTLGLPEVFRPAMSNDSAGILLYFQGRNLDSLRYSTTSAFLNTLYHLAAEKQVYAGLTTISIQQGRLNLQFYLVLTADGAAGHHFLLIDENVADSTKVSSFGNLVVHFYPFIRTDNLLSLFGTFAGPKAENPIPIEIKNK